jgi:MFS family permease
VLSQTYPFGIFSSTIIGTLNPNNTLVQNIGYGTVVNCFYLPGCIVGGFLMDRIGRKQTMTLGFFLWALLGFIIGGAITPIQKVFPLFVVLYGIFNSFGEMGPGVSQRDTYQHTLNLTHHKYRLQRSSAVQNPSQHRSAVISLVSPLLWAKLVLQLAHKSSRQFKIHFTAPTPVSKVSSSSALRLLWSVVLSPGSLFLIGNVILKTRMRSLWLILLRMDIKVYLGRAWRMKSKVLVLKFESADFILELKSGEGEKLQKIDSLSSSSCGIGSSILICNSE